MSDRLSKPSARASDRMSARPSERASKPSARPSERASKPSERASKPSGRASELPSQAPMHPRRVCRLAVLMEWHVRSLTQENSIPDRRPSGCRPCVCLHLRPNHVGFRPTTKKRREQQHMSTISADFRT
ncbi:unnamed protein product [Rhodiola kirilowii]